MTSFKSIYSRAKIVMGDYKLTKMISTDINDFYDYMRSLLVNGIPEFENSCLQTLEYTSIEEDSVDVYYFTNDLTNQEQAILAKCIVYYWWVQQIQDVTVYKSKIPSRDFKAMEIQSGLKQKSEYKDKLKEEISKNITSYLNANLDKLPFFGGG